MKAIVRIGEVLDTRASVQSAQFAPFGVAMLAEAFDGRRRAYPEAVLVVEKCKNGPVYITVGGNPPELCAGDRRVHAVFSPVESQEPLATFFDLEAARKWARVSCKKLGYTIREVDATDRVSLHVNVALVIRTPDDRVLYCRLKKSKEWTIPEGELALGESADSCARRIARELGIAIGVTKIPDRVPYVNVYLEEHGHYLSLVLIAEPAHGEGSLPEGSLYDALEWGPAGDPPRPSFVTVQTIRKLLAITEPAPIELTSG